MEVFSKEDKNNLTENLEKNIAESKRNSVYNQGWDITFKIIVFLVSISIVITSALASSEIVNKPKKWSVISTILGGISTATSVFAFSQFNFASRQQIWSIKAKAYNYLLFQIRYLNPDKEQWGKTKHIVDSWNDFTTPEQAVLPEIKLEEGLLEEKLPISEDSQEKETQLANKE